MTKMASTRKLREGDDVVMDEEAFWVEGILGAEDGAVVELKRKRDGKMSALEVGEADMDEPLWEYEQD